MKMTNISVPMKKSFAKAKSTKKGDDSSEIYSDIVPFREFSSFICSYPFQQAPYYKQV